MAEHSFSHVQVEAIQTVVPENYIDIDDELEYFDNNPKKLARAKKIAGYGRRYLVKYPTTVTDLCADAAQRLFAAGVVKPADIDLLIVVNQRPDYREPSDGHILHGKLGLSQECVVLTMPYGCAGYVYAMWLGYSLISTGICHKALLLVGDIPSVGAAVDNRKIAPLFGDAASATVLGYTKNDNPAYFVLGNDGKGFDKLISPFGGTKLPFGADVANLEWVNDNGDRWKINQGLMKGTDVFNFSTEVGPKIIKRVCQMSGKSLDEIKIFCLHQANKQILSTIADNLGLDESKLPTQTFTKYANNSTNSVVTVICDQVNSQNADSVVLCTFGIGLQWGAVQLDLSKARINPIESYHEPDDRLSREQMIEHWQQYFTQGQ